MNEQQSGKLSIANVSRRKLAQGAVMLAGGTVASSFGKVSAAATLAPKPSSEVVVNTPSSKTIVETGSGKVRGFVRNDIFAFKGIPYGATTEGKNRFMPPSKPTPWTGVRNSMSWGFVSPQTFTSTFDGRRHCVP